MLSMKSTVCRRQLQPCVRQGGLMVALAVATVLLFTCCQVTAQNTTTSSTTTTNNNDTTTTTNTTTTNNNDTTTISNATATTSNTTVSSNDAETTMAPDVDECQMGVCQNDAICEKRIGSYVCFCQDGWKGMNCTEDVDECSVNGSHPCALKANTHCMNTPGSYSCDCDDGFEPLPPDNDCKVMVILPYDNVKTKMERGTNDMTYGPFSMKEGGFMFGDTRISVYYISDNGYISFNRPFSQPTMPPAHSSRLTSLPFLAPYWADIDLTGGANHTGVYHAALFLADTYTDNATRELFKEYRDLANLTDFSPVFMAVVTWVDVLPYRAQDFPNFQPATFQVVMATDGRRMKGRVAWRTTWSRLDDFKVNAYQHLSYDTPPTAWMPLPDPPSVASFSSSDSETPASVSSCVEWIGTKGPLFNGTTGGRFNGSDDVPSCPCSLAQARVDLLFKEESKSNGTVCAMARVFDNMKGTKKHCCYRLLGGVLDKDPVEAPLPSYRDANLTSLAEEGFTKCCQNGTSGTCNLFREMIPVSDCSATQQELQYFSTALLWGNGHMTSAENITYTFNGWNEYLLQRFGNDTAENPAYSLEIQGRSENRSSVPEFNTTVFTAFVFKRSNSTRVEVHLGDDGKIKLKMEGQNATVADVEAADPEVSLTRSAYEDVLDVVFSNTVTMKVTASTDHLSLYVRAHSSSGVSDQGLLGALQTLGQHPSENVTSTLGQWALSENQSFFTYESGDNFTTYNHPDFLPTVLPTSAEKLLSQLNQTGQMELASSVCAVNVACLHDFLVTGSDSRANLTRNTQKDFRQTLETLSHSPPTYRVQKVWKVPMLSGTAFSQRLAVGASLGAMLSNVTVMVDSVPSDVTLNYTIGHEAEETYDSFTWRPDESLRNLTSLTLTFSVTDLSTGQMSEFVPVVILCPCERASECDYKAVDDTVIVTGTNTGGFFFADCKCDDSKGGRYCQDDVSVCDVCYNVTLCNANVTDGSQACRCPQGYEGGGKSCYEKDECLQPDRCDQGCSNTLGSYTCFCNAGYTPVDNGHCEDIDECQSKTDNCSSSEFCVNTVGSFLCPCRPIFGGPDCQKTVKYRYGGSLRFSDLPSRGQGWSEDLKDVQSPAFLELATKIETVLSDNLKKNNITYVTVAVVSFHPIQSARRRRRQSSGGGSSEPLVRAQFEVTSEQPANVTSLKDALQSGFDPACVSSRCRMTGSGLSTTVVLYGVDTEESGFQENYELCSSDRTNNCHNITSECRTDQNTFLCRCRPGYRHWDLYDNVCLDVDECQTNTSQALCGVSSNDTVCHNTDGSYYCDCPPSYHWDAATTTCQAVTLQDICGQTQPCKNDAGCVNTMDEARYACRCKDGWTGMDCGEEDSEAEYYKNATIGVAVGLGILCLILILVVILTMKRARSYSMD